MSVERRATRIPDGVRKLKYLRSVTGERKAGMNWLLITAACCTMLFLEQRAKPGTSPATQPASTARIETPAPQTPIVPIFFVEHKDESDLYSNGLQIRNDYRTNGSPRAYRSFRRTDWHASEPQSSPAGIVFHTTESLILPIEAEQRAPLNRTRDALLARVRDNRFYNFVIDRFGQVFRIVPENQLANHAGHSVWADETSVFIDLNDSFLGVSFEMGVGEDATAAQIHTGRLLTDMLRSAYSIPESDCVTHAQVSVNPDNLRIGYHTDWAGRFPFHEMGLTRAYETPVAAVELFGFSYDGTFLDAIGGRPWPGLVTAEQRIVQDAGAQGQTPADYRILLQHQYREIRSHRYE